jgi:acetyltransferase-like isoleucine patch superfamily enzyme
MANGRHTIFSKIRRFLKIPLSEKLNTLEMLYYRVKGAQYYRRILNRFGSGATLYRPAVLSNPRFLSVGDRTMIGRSAHIELIPEYASVHYSPKVEIGNDVYIGPNLYMVCIGSITIGDGSVLSEHVFLHDSNHGFDPARGLIMQQELVGPGNIVIGRNCFLGFRSAIMPGVTLGDHCIVGVNAVVTKSFPAYSMVAGVPAVVIKRYSHEENQWVRVS